MKKAIVISFKNVFKKITALLLILTLLTVIFSCNLPHLICQKLSDDLLISGGNHFSDSMSRLFSFHSKNTVYAAMPVQVTAEINPDIIQPIPSPTVPPISNPLPESNLSNTESVSRAVSVKNHTKKTFDISQLLQQPLSYQADSKNYKVLLVHTHTTECYFPNDRSDNAEENMIRIGKEFKKVLEDNGIPTLHITTVHDVPYTTSYKKSLQSVTQALKEYPSIEVVIDLHRDAIFGANGEKLRPIANINGNNLAQVMLVCGTDEGGLPHPDWKENLSFALKVQSNMEENYLNLARPLDLRKERFNTHTTKKSVIFEIGSHGNSLEEAVLGARLAAQSVANVLKSLN